jgi:photosystem II stability/assembly factor-like uncharacterized protein
MLLKIRSCFFVLGAVMVLCVLTACEKFDRTKIAMPKIHFITSDNLHSVVCRDTTHTWIFGNYGTIFFSSDGGSTWNRQASGVEVLLGDAAFVSPQEGWAVGVGGTVIHTVDGGETWSKQSCSTGKDLFNVFFLDAQNGWATGEYGTIIHTGDGGKTWANQTEPKDALYNNVFFADLLNGWVVGEFGTILHTTDGGKTWALQECRDIVPTVTAKEWETPKPALYGVFFADKNKGWITGMDGVILQTTDGGQNWKKLKSGTDKPIYSILIEGKKGWAVGNKGTYLVSEDGGDSWASKGDAIKSKFWLRQIAFCDQNNGFAVGAMGTVAETKDGGKTWKVISGFSYDMPEFGLADF